MLPNRRAAGRCVYPPCLRGLHNWQGAGRVLRAVGSAHARCATHRLHAPLAVDHALPQKLSFWPSIPVVFPAWALVCRAVHACTHCLLPSAVFASVPYPWLISCLVTDLPAECSRKEAVAGANSLNPSKVQVAAYHHYQGAAEDVWLEDAATPDTITSGRRP